MKRKVLSLMMTAALALSLVACGGGSNNGGGSTSSSSGSGSTSTESKQETSGDFKIGMVTDVGGVNDGSFNQSAWEGLQRAEADFGVEVNYLESKGDADYAPNIEAFIDEECDLIITVGYMLADATRAAAEANPDTNFAIIDDSSIDLPNVTCLMFKQAQASYLVGYVAGLMTESNNVGFLLGMENPTMNQFGYGYCAGVLDANPDAQIQQINANSFADSAIGKTAAQTFITNGADIIFHAAGGTGIGAIQACEEAGIYAIGVDSDQSSIAPNTVITSAMKRVDNAVYDSVSALVGGSLAAGVKTYDLSIGGVDIAPTDTLLTDDVKAAIEDVKAKIISGDIVVPETQDDFEAAHGDAYVLD